VRVVVELAKWMRRARIARRVAASHG
jgi:hypothetical protein